MRGHFCVCNDSIEPASLLDDCVEGLLNAGLYGYVAVQVAETLWKIFLLESLKVIARLGGV